VPTRPVYTLLHGPLAQRTRPTVLPDAARARGRIVAQRARRPERRAQAPAWARRRGGVTSRGGSAVRCGTHRRRELSGYARGGGRARRPGDYSGSPSSSDRRGRTAVLGSGVESGGDLRGRSRRRRAGTGRGGRRWCAADAYPRERRRWRTASDRGWRRGQLRTRRRDGWLRTLAVGAACEARRGDIG
jgi:hypothetical protein